MAALSTEPEEPTAPDLPNRQVSQSEVAGSWNEKGGDQKAFGNRTDDEGRRTFVNLSTSIFSSRILEVFEERFVRFPECVVVVRVAARHAREYLWANFDQDGERAEQGALGQTAANR